VNAGTGSPTALIVDDDVAFILWLGEVFAETGYQAFPALRCREALSLAKTFGLRIDVLVLNPQLPGAKRAMKVLASTQPNLRLVLIWDPSIPGPVPDSAHATLERPSVGEDVSRPHWVAKIRKILMRPAK